MGFLYGNKKYSMGVGGRGGGGGVKSKFMGNRVQLIKLNNSHTNPEFRFTMWEESVFGGRDGRGTNT